MNSFKNERTQTHFLYLSKMPSRAAPSSSPNKAAATHGYTLKLANGSTKQIVRRKRVPLRQDQKEELERVFQSKCLPKGKEGQNYMRDLALKLELQYQQVRKWFDNRVQKQNLHEARALAILSGEIGTLNDNPRSGYKRTQGGNSTAPPSKKRRSIGGKGKNGKSPGKGFRLSMSDASSGLVNSKGPKNILSEPSEINPEVVASMKGLNEFFNETDVDDIIDQNARETVFNYIVSTIKGKRTGSLYQVLQNLLKEGNPKMFENLKTLFQNGGYDDLVTRILHETVSIKTTLVWNALTNFQHRKINSISRSSALVFDASIDPYKTIKRLVSELVPEYVAKCPTKRGDLMSETKAAKKALKVKKTAAKAKKAAKKKTPIKKVKAKAVV